MIVLTQVIDSGGAERRARSSASASVWRRRPLDARVDELRVYELRAMRTTKALCAQRARPAFRASWRDAIVAAVQPYSLDWRACPSSVRPRDSGRSPIAMEETMQSRL